MRCDFCRNRRKCDGDPDDCQFRSTRLTEEEYYWPNEEGKGDDDDEDGTFCRPHCIAASQA